MSSPLYDASTLCALLLKEGLITETQRREILIKEPSQRARIIKEKREELQKKSGRKKVSYEPSAVEVISSFQLPISGSHSKTMTEEKITEVLAKDAGMTYRKIDPLTLDMKVVTKILSGPYCRKNLIIPMEETGDGLVVAVADPYNQELLENLKKVSGKNVIPVVSTKSDILKTIMEFFGLRHALMAAEKDYAPQFDISNLEQYVKMKPAGEIEPTDQPVVNAVWYLFQYAFENRASDIHIEPKRETCIVRMRIDGALHTIHSIPSVVHPAIISRIKMLSRMDIAEKRRPQDGRIKTSKDTKEIEMRVSTLPVAFGEKVVIRIFDPEVLMQDLGELGFFPGELKLFTTFIEKPHGIILVTGPTGSGKTTTLYSALKTLATPDVNITTIEDPIEMAWEEFNQVGVQPKADLTFASTLRAILRQDPDIIMVGEIRDKETAENAIQAALTGHLVLSTLHTNDTASAVTRLIDLGVEPFLVSSSIIGIMAQRLVRKICPDCEKSTQLDKEHLERLGLSGKEGKIYSVKCGEGCVNCRGTGYFGRTGVFEVMNISDEIKKLITTKADAGEIKKQARKEGMITLFEAAVKKMAQGVTTFEEVIRATME